MGNEKKRTGQQNKALHLMFAHLAENLNSNGFDMKRTLKAHVDIPWTAQTVKDYLWRPIQEAQVMKKSTTELTTKEIDEVFDTLNRYLGQITGVYTPFPSIEEILLQRKLNDKGGRK